MTSEDQSKHFRRFEAHLIRGSTEAAKVLGVPYSTYAQYRAGTHPAPLHLFHHIDAITRLPLDRLHTLIHDRLA